MKTDNREGLMAAKVKRFSFHWGSGIVAEEAQIEGPYHRPTLQLLKYTEGDAAGQVSVRFCHYSNRGGFQRSPLVISPAEIESMGEALRSTPALRAILARMLGDKHD